MDAEHRRWLENLIAACERVAAAQVADPDDPRLRNVLNDVDALRVRLLQELCAAQ